MRTTSLLNGFLFLLPVLVLILCETSRIQEGESRECSVDDDCQSIINGSTCDAGGNCTCPEIMSVVVTVKEQNTSYCMTGFNVTGGNCSFSEQCNYSNGKCTEGVCGCDIRFTVTETGICAPVVKSAIIPIAVGVAIGVAVFGTLCLYLWLSRTKREAESD